MGWSSLVTWLPGKRSCQRSLDWRWTRGVGTWVRRSFAVSRGQRGHFIPLLGTIDLVFLYWRNQYDYSKITMMKWKQHNKMEMIWGQKNLNWRILLPVSCVTLGKSLNFSELPFPHLQNEDNQSYLIGWWRIWKHFLNYKTVCESKFSFFIYKKNSNPNTVLNISLCSNIIHHQCTLTSSCPSLGHTRAASVLIMYIQSAFCGCFPRLQFCDHRPENVCCISDLRKQALRLVF